MSTARQRWKSSIRNHIQEVPKEVVDRNPTLVYRLRGEGYFFSEATGSWQYERAEGVRNGLIQKYRQERAEATAIARAAAKAKRKARRTRVRVKEIRGRPNANAEVRVSG